jgi:hypothetical protein
MTNHIFFQVLIKLTLTIILIFNYSGGALYATTILIYIGKNEIIVGADSRNVRKGYDSDSLQYIEICKIRKAESFFYAMSGFTNSDSYDFHPYEIVQHQLSESQDFDSAITNLRDTLTSKLIGILQKIKTNPLSWKMIVTKENRIIDLAIIGKIDGAFGVYRMGFVLTDPENFKIEIEESMIECTSETSKFIGFGECDESKNYIVQNLKVETPQELIKNAIKAQSFATPITVGEPLNLIAITADSYEWITSENCN